MIDDFQRLHIEGFKKRNVKLRTVDKGHFDELVEYEKALRGEETSVVTVEDGGRATMCSLKVLDSIRDKKVVEIQLP